MKGHTSCLAFCDHSQVPSRLSAGFQHLSQDLIETSPADEYLWKNMFIILLHVLNTLQLLPDKVFTTPHNIV